MSANKLLPLCPLIAFALFYAFMPYVVGFETTWENNSQTLIYRGLGVSLLRDAISGTCDRNVGRSMDFRPDCTQKEK